ncbi:C39 family peptidase [Adlercreutzia mucosicola]|uniref:C39 family peptidase n=1 Tax=Adlercreutzia mucosicola TaxID=580026 RepID=UPI002B2560D8|nr:C39 family peptidase [Adlercreutzia mucosicola]MEB1814639.1 C39 family peptidase [Adlercreutzia mucosicola]
MNAATHSCTEAASLERPVNPYSRDAWPPPRPLAVRQGMRVVPLVGAIGLAVFLLIAAFQLASLYLGGPGDASQALAASAEPARPGDGSEAASTPRSEWRAGEMPYLYQIDPTWSSAPYAGTDVAEAGCGPTSLAMVYVALTGKTDYDPEAMAAFSESGGYVEEGMTAWRFMRDGAAQLGLASRELSPDAGQVLDALRSGQPVICSVGPGDFTTTGHFIVLAGVADDGGVVVHDPNSPANSAKTWEVDRILGQCRNLWAFQRA